MQVPDAVLPFLVPKVANGAFLNSGLGVTKLRDERKKRLTILKDLPHFMLRKDTPK